MRRVSLVLALLLAAASPAQAQAQFFETDEPGLELPQWANETPPRPLTKTPPPPMDQPPPVPLDELKRGIILRLSHEDPAWRWGAVVLCGEHGFREAVPKLTALMVQDDTVRVRVAAAWALGQLKALNAAPNLKAVAWRDKEKAVRNMARSALHHMGQKIKPGPYWEWPEYKDIAGGRKFGIGVLAGGGGLGLGLLTLAFIGGVACEVDGGLFSNNDCTEWETVAVFGVSTLALAVIIGVPMMVYYQGKLNEVTPEWVGPLPIPVLSATRHGGKLGLTWRF